MFFFAILIREGKLPEGDFVLGWQSILMLDICEEASTITLCNLLLLLFLHADTEKSLNSKTCNLSLRSFNL